MGWGSASFWVTSETFFRAVAFGQLKGEEELSGLSCLSTARGQGVYSLDFHHTPVSVSPGCTRRESTLGWVGMGRLGFLEVGSAAM